jgi:uncharacterized membrane protein YphA (DoxX/SURF4 family)
MRARVIRMILCVFLGCVFLVAGIIRLMNMDHGRKEQQTIYPFIPYGHVIIMIAELVLGSILLLNYDGKNTFTAYVLLGMIVVGTWLVVLRYRHRIWQGITTIGTYHVNSLSVVLHMCIIMMLVIYIMLSL